MRRATVGVAMVVRNGAETMERALDPFVGTVDQVAIVLGGKSTDGTEKLARQYVTHPDRLVRYDGPLDEEGRLCDFGAARQLVADALATEWMMVVDADDVWEGVEEHLGALVADLAEAKERYGMVQFPYRVGAGDFLQPRLMRRLSGHWRAPVHEYWDLDPGWKLVQTDLIQVQQERGGGADKPQHQDHKITIAEAWLVDPACTDRDRLRTLALLGRDYVDAGFHADALRVLDDYLVERSVIPVSRRGEDADRHFEAHYCRAAAFLRLERYADALQAAAMALTVQPHGMAWTVMAEAALWMGRATRATALLEMCVMCAQKALETGRVRTAAWSSRAMVTTVPLALKAQALVMLGRRPEALAALDLALGLDPGYAEAERLREQLYLVQSPPGQESLDER